MKWLPKPVTDNGESMESPASITPLLAVDNLLSNLGQYSLVPVLGVLIAAQGSSSEATAVGGGLFVYFATVGLGSLVVNRWVARLGYVAAICLSSVLAAAGFFTLGYLHDPGALLAVLLVAGLGVSVHQVLGRVLIAENIAGDVERNKAYSTMNVALNAAGALGPFIASAAYVSPDARPLLTVVAVCYILGAVVMLTRLPKVLPVSRRRPAPPASGWPISRAAVVEVLRSPAAWRTVVVGMLATFVYAQFYSAFALFVAGNVAVPVFRAVLLSGPAIAIVVLQSTATAGIARLQLRGVPPVVLLGTATVVFGLAVIPLGSGIPTPAACVLTIVLFSAAEMVFTPMMSTAFAALPADSRLEALNFRQISYTVGEAFGSLVGGSLFVILSVRGLESAYWLGIGILAIAATLVLLARRPWVPPAGTVPETGEDA
ncbi:MFS family permease [Amycolatopsis bartoniae]|uniref:Major facilitator superfamily (MFS) profile domain-containing protein n=1 Tax=Amycolatopsis bartoniae TaxID=941986 RepID=A0A8H9IVL6_9PSEU|nr:MFS transporter [Amycolatopsis bartoniae]MBB2940209.1 MFS family permease [Amycolatopsis bartoniae]TVT11299.1 MFS transporter [Amycolatopsis bartoniae]GHF66427.1 hypothetical protein GCM10017566_45270 [Amycolatopsis bartoniae]